MPDQRSRQVPTILGITLLGAACRLFAIGQPMRFDESISWAYYVGRPWGSIVASYQQPNNHVFYSLLAKLLAQGVDYAPWALRLPAFIAGVAIVPLTWAVGRRFADEKSAMLAAALSVGATQLVLYATNARGYSLVVALFLVLLLVADELRLSAALGKWTMFSLTAAAGLYTIPVMLYPLGVVVVWLALASRPMDRMRRPRFLAALAAASLSAGILAGLLYLPIVATAGLHALAGNKFVEPSPWPKFAAALPRMVVSTLASWVSPLPWWSTAGVAFLALIGVRRRAPDDRPSLVAAAAIWCGALLMATHRAPFVRVWLFLLPLFLIAVARGVLRCLPRFASRDVPRDKWMPLAVATITLVVAATTHAAEQSDDTGTFRSARDMTAILSPRLRAGDRVLALIPTFGPLLYYFPRAGADTAMLTVPLYSSRRAFLVLDPRQGQTLAWALARHIIDPAQFAEPTLIARYPDGELWEASRRQLAGGRPLH